MDNKNIFVKPITEVPLMQMPTFSQQPPLFPKLFASGPSDTKPFQQNKNPSTDPPNLSFLKQQTPLFGSKTLFGNPSQGIFNKPAQNQPPKDSSNNDNAKKMAFGLFNNFNNNAKQQAKAPQKGQDTQNRSIEGKSQSIFGKKQDSIFSMGGQKKNQFLATGINIFGNNQKSSNNVGSASVQNNPSIPSYSSSNSSSSPGFNITQPLFGGVPMSSIFKSVNIPPKAEQKKQPQQKKQQKKQATTNNFMFNFNKKQQKPPQPPQSHQLPQPSQPPQLLFPPPIIQQKENKQISQVAVNANSSSSNSLSTPQFKPSVPLNFGNKQPQNKDTLQPKKEDSKLVELFPKKEQKNLNISFNIGPIANVQTDKNPIFSIFPKKQQKKQSHPVTSILFNQGAQTKSDGQKPGLTLKNIFKNEVVSQPINLLQKRDQQGQKSQSIKSSSQSSFKKLDLFNNKNFKQGGQQPLVEIPQEAQIQQQDKKPGELNKKTLNFLSSNTHTKPTIPNYLKRVDSMNKLQNQKNTQKQGRRITKINLEEEVQQQNLLTHQTNKINSQQYFQLQQLIHQSFKSKQEKYWQKIQNTFRVYMSIDRKNNSYQTTSENNLSQDENKFIFDFTCVIGNCLGFPQSSFKAFAKLFYIMMKESGYWDNLFDERNLRRQLLDQVYKKNQFSNQYILKIQQPYCIKILGQFISLYSSYISTCLKKIEQNIRIIKNKQIFEFFLEVSLTINIRSIKNDHPDIIKVLRANDKRQLTHLNRILKGVLAQTSRQIISLDKIIKLIPLVDQLLVCQSSKIYQNFLLKAFNYDDVHCRTNKIIIDQISKTKNLIFMPFRAIQNRVYPQRQQINPYLKDLFQQIDGPEWSDWLSVYLGEDNIRLKQKQTQYLINSLKKMKINNIDKILLSQIKRLIDIMRQQQQVKNYYEALSYIIYDDYSIQTVQKEFCSKNKNFFDDFRSLAQEMSRFPNCIFTEDDVLQIIGKSTYLLTTLSLCPNKALKYQNAMFDNLGFIEEYDERCDRVCHLVLDTLSYFSINQLNQQIISKSFEAIISLLQNNETKQSMILALNVNIPCFDLFNKYLPNLVIQKMYFFITHLVSSMKFYDSTRISESSTKLSKAYPLRYNTERYLSQVVGIQYAMPISWLASCLKITVKQGYNPEFLQIILSKLRIYASKQSVIQSPLVLTSIVQGCNCSNFFKQLNSKLQAQILQQKGQCVIFNNYLQENEGSSVNTVFYSLKLLKTLIQLRKIRNKAQEDSPKHYLSQLLSSLDCLKQLDKYYFYGTSQFEITTTKTIPPVLNLLALTLQLSPLVNSSDNFKTEWLFVEGVSINYENLSKMHKQTAKQIDYSILRDPLAHPQTPNLECYDCISSLAYDCLSQIMVQQKQLSVETLLFLIITKKREVYKQKDIISIKNQLVDEFCKNLMNEQVKISRSAWNLLNIMRSSKQNKRLAQQIFKKYFEKKPQFDNIKKIKPVAQFLRESIKDGQFAYSNLIEKILAYMSKVESDNIMELLQSYRKKSIYIQSVHQFDRLIHEKKMLNAYQYYQIMCLISQIVLHEVFNKCSPIHLYRHSSLLTTIIAKSDILDIFYVKDRQELQLSEQICDANCPRLYGADILQMFISNSTRTRDYLIDIQINNVLNWFNQKIRVMNEKIRSFLSVMFSIDQTYYANHPIQLKTKFKSQLFCQLHLGIIGYDKSRLFGDKENDSTINIKLMIESLLQKIKNLIKKIDSSQFTQQITKTYNLIDLAVNWLRSSKQLNREELNLSCQKVLTACFYKLGDPITNMSIAKLLLTCVNILKDNLSKDIMGNLRQTIMKTLSSDDIDINLKQQLLSLFLIAVPAIQQTHILQKIASLWCNQINDQHFYNQSRIMYKLCSIYPIQMVRLKIIPKCDRMLRAQQGSHYFFDKNQVFRTTQTKSWVWIVKIVTTLMENGEHSTLVVNQVSKFVNISKKKIFSVLNQFKQGGNSLKNKNKNNQMELTLAKLDELQATLQLFIVLAQCKMWVEMNRQLFEQLFYYIVHRTIVIFKNNYEYKPWSFNEKLMLKVNSRENIMRLNSSQPYGTDSEITDQNSRTFTRSPNVFRFIMCLRFNDCLKLWLLSCSTGMRNSCFVRQYFTQPIKGTNFKYMSTYWDHLYKSLLTIIQYLFKTAKNWCNLDNGKLINLANDCLNSAQFFTETGYLYSIIRFIQNEDQLVSEIGQTFSLAFEMGACHLVSQIYYRSRNKTSSKQYLQGLQQRLFKQSIKAEQEVRKLYKDTTDIDQNAVLKYIQSSRKMLEQIQI